MEMVKFEDEGPLARLYNAESWPGFYSSFFPPHHFTSQSLPLCQQPFLSSEPCLCAPSFNSSQTSSLGYSDNFTHNFLPSPPPSSLSSDYSCPDCFLHHPHPNLPPPILPSHNIYRSLYQDQLAPIKTEPLPFFTHNYLSRLPPPSLPSNNCCACCASDSSISTQLPSPPLSSASDHHQEAMSCSPVSAHGKSPAAVGVARESPAAVLGGSVGGPSRVLPAQTRAQKIRAVLDEYEITSPALIQRLIPLPVGREEKRSFVRLLRLHGVSYADIKNLGELSTSLSTLRGWDRMKKPPSDRPRIPRWNVNDVKVMKRAVDAVVGTMELGSPGFWRCVEEVMARTGASHRFSAQAIAAKYDNRSRGDIARQKANTMAQ
ncbi:uncharacterized protein FFB20_14016 [Fusarium fujikuroi]|nr:uncharacterized protein FFE2_04243 [Fusarium fujikuroi]SCN80949.1 uncharacterized protein FFM5_02577 [Fusarium fujikuroi]SCN97296.1 uncharacterized protein FFC1_07829 [Fusarium fujikuroi]SCO12523.1 uncharacterized protein FFB20_14016 [Fusarium fujikuroi]SCO32642.1 uncharacterized protein FFMR_02521 [Fusarium fujikuroi]